MFLNCNNFHQFVHICFPVQRAFSLPIIHYFLHPGPRKQPDQAADAVSLLIFLFCSSRQNWVCLPVKICLKQNLFLFFFRADIGTSGLQFCDSPRSPLVFKGTQQSLKPHCSVFLPHCNLTLSRCLQHSIYCSAFLQNPGGKSSAPFSSPAAPASAVPPFSPRPAFPSGSQSHGRSAVRGAQRAGARFVPRECLPAGRACTAQLGRGRNPRLPGPHPALPLTGPGSRELPRAAPPSASPGRQPKVRTPSVTSDTKVCPPQATLPNTEPGLWPCRPAALWSGICSWDAPAGPCRAVPRPCAFTGGDTRSVHLLRKNEVFLLPGCRAAFSELSRGRLDASARPRPQLLHFRSASRDEPSGLLGTNPSFASNAVVLLTQKNIKGVK